jgi:hypothetical protein
MVLNFNPETLTNLVAGGSPDSFKALNGWIAAVA